MAARGAAANETRAIAFKRKGRARMSERGFLC